MDRKVGVFVERIYLERRLYIAVRHGALWPRLMDGRLPEDSGCRLDGGVYGGV